MLRALLLAAADQIHRGHNVYICSAISQLRRKTIVAPTTDYAVRRFLALIYANDKMPSDDIRWDALSIELSNKIQLLAADRVPNFKTDEIQYWEVQKRIRVQMLRVVADSIPGGDEEVPEYEE